MTRGNAQDRVPGVVRDAAGAVETDG